MCKEFPPKNKEAGITLMRVSCLFVLDYLCFAVKQLGAGAVLAQQGLCPLYIAAAGIFIADDAANLLGLRAVAYREV